MIVFFHTIITTGIQFTAEEEALFARRYENNYDIPNERYELWLKSTGHGVQIRKQYLVNSGE